MAETLPNETKVIKRVLPVKLTEEERLQRADALANALQQVQDRKVEKRRVTKEADRAIAEAEQESVDLRDAVATGREYQEVIVHKVYDYEKATVTEVRTDTGETIKSRGMTDDERQQKLLEDGESDNES